jgi:hypothetical protein
MPAHLQPSGGSPKNGACRFTPTFQKVHFAKCAMNHGNSVLVQRFTFHLKGEEIEVLGSGEIAAHLPEVTKVSQQIALLQSRTQG